ncbi:MAG: class I SAM-dependent methyltransferase [Oscillochloridaceae bacterium umkhey_bin13]
MNPYETERLARVYADYANDAATRARWDGRNPGNAAIVAERQRSIRALLAAAGLLPLAGRRILEIGCGSGGVLSSLLALGAQPEDLYGVDLLPDRVAMAAQRLPCSHVQVANAEALPFPAARFELIAIFTVFSSILDPAMRRNVASEVRRVLRPGGAVLWYDFRYNNPRNPHVRGVTRPQIAALFPDLTLQLQRITLLPPLARRLGALTPWLYAPLAGVPLLRTHEVGVLRLR